MSNDLNQCQFIGRLGQDPEVRYTQDGKAVANITLAVGESWKDKNSGQRQEKTEWVRIVFFGGVANVVAEYLKKGSKIYVSGKQKTRKWQDQSGQDRYTTEVVVDGFSGVMQMLDSNNTGSDASQKSSQPPAQTQQQQAQQQNNASQSPAQNSAPGGPLTDEFSDNIPFAPHEKGLLA